MASSSTDGPRIDWEAVGEYADLSEVVRLLKPERVIQLLGVDRAIQVIGLDHVIETVGLSAVIEASGAEKVMKELMKHRSPEQLQEMIRREQQPE